MKKAGLILFLTCSMPVYLAAQTAISKACNAPRAGDRLVKQQVEYKAPGDEGRNVVWDFGRQETVNDHYELKYYGYGDSLVVGQEHRTLYKYIVRADSLFTEGFENQTTLIANQVPELLLVYPMAYGNKHESYFHGNGDYGNHLFITVRGKSSVAADACGMLILPSADTLRNVLRTHQVRKIAQRMVPYPLIEPTDTIYSTDSIDHHLANDTLWMQQDIYRWYADGYRYPVFETLQVLTHHNGKPVVSSNTSFYYTPVDQYYDLGSDPQNQARRDEEQARAQAQQNSGTSGQPGNESEGGNDEIIRYGTSLSDDGNVLTLEYDLSEPAEVSVMLFDIQSRQLTGSKKIMKPAGTYHETFSLAGYQPGEYALRILVNEKVYGIKIIK